MAENFQHGNKPDQPRAKSGGLCNESDLAQVNNCTCFSGDPMLYGSDTQQIPEDLHPFSLNFPFSFDHSLKQTEFDLVSAVVSATNKSDQIWPPPEVPSSLPDDYLTSISSNTYDTHDFDRTDQRVLLTPSTTRLDDHHTIVHGPSEWNLRDVPHSNVPLGSDNNLTVLAVDHPEAIAKSQTTTLMHKRKRPSASSSSKKGSQDLIDKNFALKLCIENMPNPSFDAIERLANGFGFHWDYVMDLCLQQRSKTKFDSPHLNDTTERTYLTSVSTESADFGVPTREDSGTINGVDGPTATISLIKRPRSDSEVLPVTNQDPESNRVQCPKCGVSVCRKADLSRHLDTHNPRKFPCRYPRCKKIFRRKDKLNNHLRRIHGDIISKADALKRKEKDPEDDPDSESSRPQGSLPLNRPLGALQRDTSSTSARHAASGSFSGGDVNGSTHNREIFQPFLQNTPANEFMRKFNRAHVIRKLGQGGFGHVYELSITAGKNSDDGNNETFACKVIRLPDHGVEEVIGRARNEINILQILDHPNIIAFSGAFISAGGIMISTRPVADCNLKEFLNKLSSPLSSVAKSQLWEAVRNLASALAYLHCHRKGEGFHGDIKPENILVIQDIEIKSWIRLLLADFGSARLPISNSQVGYNKQPVTLRYCAPEWFVDKKERGPPSDIWSFGCILAQIVTYLHDRTLADLEMFRSLRTEFKEDWTYHESLPMLTDWLHFLSKNSNELAGSDIPSGYVDLIVDMLATIPSERPSAMDVVTRLELCKNSFTAKASQIHDCSIDLLGLGIPQNATTKFHVTANCGPHKQPRKGEYEWMDQWTGLCPIAENSSPGKSTLMNFTIDSPIQASIQKLGLSNTDISCFVAAGVSQLHEANLGTVQIPDPASHVQKSITPLSDFPFAAQPFGKEDILPYNCISTRSIYAKPFTFSKAGSEIKTIHEQAFRNLLFPRRHGQPYFHLKLVPKCQKSGFQASEKRLPPGLINSGGYYRPQKSGQRLNRRRSSRRDSLVGSTESLVCENACWNCQIRKFGSPSTPYKICDGCRELVPSPSRTTLYFRHSLLDYTPYFFPDFVHSRLRISAIEGLLRENKVGFTTNKITVHMSSGPDYPTIKLITTEFVTSNRDFLNFSYVQKSTIGDFHEFVPAYELPLGINNESKQNLIQSCLTHASLINRHSRSPGEYVLGETSIISWKIFDAVNGYRKLSYGTGRNGALLQKACMLHAMHYFMNRIITLTKTSAKKAIARLRTPTMLPYAIGPIITSRLLNLQIKSAMQAALLPLTMDVLHGLDRLFIQHPTQSSWADCFCITVILCMCIEEVQISIDSFTVAASKNTSFCGLHLPTMLLALDNAPFRELIELFHVAYKTAGSCPSQTGGSGLNPIRYGLPVDEKKGITQQMADLVCSIRQIMDQHADVVEEKAGNLTLQTKSNPLENHMAFRKRNSGRLVSKFLKSFT